MRLLFIVNGLIDLKNNVNKNGGIEHCNIELANRLSLLGHDVSLASKISKIQKNRNIVNFPLNYLFANEKNNFYDVIISSNYSQAFKFRNNALKVLWMHNELQIEKSLRRKEFFY